MMNHSEAGKLGYEKTKHKLIEHYQKRQKEAIEKYFSALKYCPNCKKEISYEKRINKFCSHSCSANYNNLNARENGKHKIIKNCLNCEKHLNYNNTKYCNKKCEVNYKWKLKKQNIENGLVHSPIVQKKYLKEKYGEKCSICNINEWMGKVVPLVLDHIDGNSENNFPNNLRLVCGNCNMQLDTFAGKNKGNGRQWRREKRAQGKWA